MSMDNVRIHIAAAPFAGLSARRFHIREGMSTPFRIVLVAVSNETNLDLSGFVGHSAEVELVWPERRRWRGIIESMRFLRASEAHDSLATYEITVVATLWRLSQRIQCRLFQHATIPEIVDRLLVDWGIEREWNIHPGAYPTLELRTQYEETDLAFVSRLLEQAGISYWFSDEGETDSTLHLGDAPESNEPRSVPLVYVDEPTAARAARLPFATDSILSEFSRPGVVTLRDYDPRRPRKPLYPKAASGRAEEAAHEQFHFAPGSHLRDDAKGDGQTPVADDKGTARHDPARGSEQARLMLEALHADRRLLSFRCSTNDASPGSIVLFANHPRADVVSCSWLAVSFVLEGEVARNDEWAFTVSAVSTDHPYRPRRATPQPRMFGIQTAVVVGTQPQEGKTGIPIPAAGAVGVHNSVPLSEGEMNGKLTDDDIYVDEYGRVRVQFPWDRNNELDGDSSVWMRVSQGWAGSGYGLFTIPRVGHEVLVAFLNGDPDCPMVVGRVHNGSESVPFPLPQNKTVSTWKTASTPGGGGFNELRFDDASGREHVYLQAQKNMDRLVKQDLKDTVGGETSRYAQRTDNIAVGATRTKFVNLDEVEVTGLNQVGFIGMNRVTSVGVEDSTIVGSRWSVTLARGLSRRLLHEIEGAAQSLGATMRSAATSVLGMIPGDPLANPATSALADFGASAFSRLRDLGHVVSDFKLDPGPPPTSIEMVDRRITLSTGEASIVLDGPNVTISAQGVVAIHAHDNITILAEKEVAIAARNKAAIVSATDNVILQAGKDLHLNPYPGASLAKLQSAEGEVGCDAPVPEECPECGAAMARVGLTHLCENLKKKLEGVGSAPASVELTGEEAALLAKINLARADGGDRE